MKELPNWARMAVMNASSIARGLRPGAQQYATEAKTTDKGISGQPENAMVAENNSRCAMTGYTANQSIAGGWKAHQSVQTSITPPPTVEMNDRESSSFESWDSSLASQNVSSCGQSCMATLF
jgi:hypothetical protein